MAEQVDSDIEQDVEWERKWHRFEQIMWALMFLLLAAACAGALGEGAVSRQTSSSSSLRVEYDRLLHARSPADISVHVLPEATQKGEVSLIFSGALAGKSAVQSSSPALKSSQITGDSQMRMTFAVDAGGPATIRFRQLPEGVARLTSRIAAADDSGVEITQIVLP